MNKTKEGVFLALGAFIIWGVVPIYFKLIQEVNSFEILVHRIIWSFVLLYFILKLTKQIRLVKEILNDKKMLFLLTCTSLLVSSNWLIFIWAVNKNLILETSLGYFINPIISIALGILALKEEPSGFQKIAILLVVIAIVYQVVTLGYLPIVSLALAFSFAFYGFLRKKICIPALPGLYIETMIITPISICFLLYWIFTSSSSFLPITNYNTFFLLFLAGPVTVLPLICFTAATTRLKLSTLGYFQYIGPTISMLIAKYVYHENLSKEKLITFGIIWIALIIVSSENFIKAKK